MFEKIEFDDIDITTELIKNNNINSLFILFLRTMTHLNNIIINIDNIIAPIIPEYSRAETR